MKVGILGAGAWGRAIGSLLERNGHAVSYRHHFDRDWPEGIESLALALPVSHLRETLSRFPAPGVPVLSLSKGMETGSGLRVSRIVAEAWKEERVAALSGPNFAGEIVRGLPAAAVVAAEDEALAGHFQSLLHQKSFRLYRSGDLAGVELGGSLKNVYAIAAGVCRGLDLGENAFAALVTRALAEMTRLGLRLGGRAETFAGLSGAGDLLLTCGSAQSRNFRVGQGIAQGRSLEAIVAETGLAEGVSTTRSVAGNPAIPAEARPIASGVAALLFDGASPRQVVEGLLERAVHAE
ncbi:MAG: NAD(P)H-dependent glycerol-3-phosphate dehydrogenase [Verrucomicrobium sp.]|nr:NAD(P)H-dependent glycerol-3-phosphate dehydrogenase [Verrucomicrobium sp.]